MCGSLFSLSSCQDFDDVGQNIPNKIVAEFDSSKNDTAPTGHKGVNEQILYETVLLEDVLKENVLTENIIKERIYSEIVNDEYLISEDVEVECINVEIYNDVDEMDEDFCCESYYSIDMDYALIKQRIASGTSLVLAEILIDAASCVIDIVTVNWGGLAIDAGQIIVTAGGTTLSAFIASLIAISKSLKAGNSYEMVMYDALYEGSKAFYYSAVVISSINAVISLFQLTDLAIKGVKSLVSFIKSKKSISLVDGAGKTIGNLTSEETIKLSVKGKVKECKISCATDLSGNSIDLYDVNTKTYVATLNKVGDSLSFTVRNVPNEILLKSGNNAGKAKYVFNGTEAFKVTYATDGTAVKTFIGNIDAGGFIKNNYGQIIKRIDFETGKEINGFTRIIKSSKTSKITTDVFGELVEITNDANKTMKHLTKKKINGVITYVDSKNNKILKVCEGSDGVSYLMSVSDNINYVKVAGALKDGRFDFDWKTFLDYRRSNATSTIRKQLVEYVKENNINIVRQNFPELTLEMIDYIKSYGKIPTTIQVHHIKNVANYPDLADDFENLVVLTKKSHLEAHGGNFHNASSTKPYCYINLKWLFDL
ncbi:MAG: HNH endonuclease signature motif containing protein [Christensenellales bacterium]